MLNPSDGLAQDVSRRLKQGVLPEVVIDELVARGLSQATAQRFVDRAIEDIAKSPSPVSTETAGASSWMQAVKVAGVLVILIGAGFGIRSWWQEQQRKEAAAAELAAADQERAAQIRAESEVDRYNANTARSAEVNARLGNAVEQLQSNRPLAQCDAILLLGRSGSKTYVGPLADLLRLSTSDSVRICAASGLRQLGEIDTTLSTYREWAGSQNADLHRAGISGFGEIGPSAAEVGMPYLERELDSQYWDARYLAVESLGKMGPAAAPLLLVASKDTDERVRDRAARLLKALDQPSAGAR